jgi:hypothetical protein
MGRHVKLDLNALNEPAFADKLDEILILLRNLHSDTEAEGMFAISDKLAEATGPVQSARDAATQYHTGELSLSGS